MIIIIYYEIGTKLLYDNILGDKVGLIYLISLQYTYFCQIIIFMQCPLSLYLTFPFPSIDKLILPYICLLYFELDFVVIL